MENSDYTKIYSTLGVFQDDGWEVVRAAYKKQIKRWHPDRFQDPSHRKIAEEKSKEINHAYQKLCDYYEKFGVLPPDHSVETSAMEATSPSTTVSADSQENDHTYAHSSAPGPSAPRRSYISIVLVGTLFAIGYSIWDPVFVGSSDSIETSMNAHSETKLEGGISAAIKNPDADEDTQPDNGLVPAASHNLNNSADANIWNPRDNQTIHKTSSANVSENYKPAFEIDDTAPAKEPALIKKGSSKKDVLTVQGPPQRQTDTAWDYGASRIYFQGGHVSGWYENPMNPLNLAR